MVDIWVSGHTACTLVSFEVRALHVGELVLHERVLVTYQQELLTVERPSEQVRLDHIPGLQYITEDRAQAEVVARAAVNYILHTHQVHREIRPTLKPMQDFFGAE